MTAILRSISPVAAPTAPPDADPEAFRLAMRQLASGVSIVTLGEGDARNGLTATSVSSLSADPPTLIVCVNRSASLYPRLTKGERIGVSVLAAEHSEYADAFAGRAALKGSDRFRDGRWATTAGGVSILVDAIAAFECEIDELVERGSHAIVIGRVLTAHARPACGALIYWRGAYDQVGWSADQISRAVGVTPIADKRWRCRD
jgi:flavin reductase (DIM6/NTAB) family NADH-FMN oxidoreductase RutF